MFMGLKHHVQMKSCGSESVTHPFLGQMNYLNICWVTGILQLLPQTFSSGK